MPDTISWEQISLIANALATMLERYGEVDYSFTVVTNSGTPRLTRTVGKADIENNGSRELAHALAKMAALTGKATSKTTPPIRGGLPIFNTSGRTIGAIGLAGCLQPEVMAYVAITNCGLATVSLT